VQSVVVGVDDVVRDKDDDVGDKFVVDEDVEDGGTGGDLEGSCWTPRLS
jgi:hypothetical protein